MVLTKPKPKNLVNRLPQLIQSSVASEVSIPMYQAIGTITGKIRSHEDKLWIEIQGRKFPLNFKFSKLLLRAQLVEREKTMVSLKVYPCIAQVGDVARLSFTCTGILADLVSSTNIFTFSGVCWERSAGLKMIVRFNNCRSSIHQFARNSPSEFPIEWDSRPTGNRPTFCSISVRFNAKKLLFEFVDLLTLPTEDIPGYWFEGKFVESAVAPVEIIKNLFRGKRAVVPVASFKPEESRTPRPLPQLRSRASVADRSSPVQPQNSLFQVGQRYFEVEIFQILTFKTPLVKGAVEGEQRELFDLAGASCGIFEFVRVNRRRCWNRLR
jgi:hypothetical protein